MARTVDLRELEHDERRERAVGFEEIADLLEHRGVGQRRRRHVAEQPDLAVLGRQPPHHLHAAEHHQIVDRRHQPAVFRIAEEIFRREQRAVLVAQPRQRLVVAHLALRQRDDRLEKEVDAVGLDRARDQRHDDLALLQPLEMAACRARVLAPARRVRRGRRSRRARSGRQRPAPGRRAPPARQRSHSPGSAHAPRPRRQAPSRARRVRRSRRRAARSRPGSF